MSNLIVVEPTTGDPGRWQLFGNAHLSEHARVQMFETLQASGTGVHRVRYSYYLVVNDHEVGGYERHEAHDEPVHLHCTTRDGGHKPGGEPCEAVSFKEALEHAWRWLSDNGAGGPTSAPTS